MSDFNKLLHEYKPLENVEILAEYGPRLDDRHRKCKWCGTICGETARDEECVIRLRTYTDQVRAMLQDVEKYCPVPVQDDIRALAGEVRETLDFVRAENKRVLALYHDVTREINWTRKEWKKDIDERDSLRVQVSELTASLTNVRDKAESVRDTAEAGRLAASPVPK